MNLILEEKLLLILKIKLKNKLHFLTITIIFKLMKLNQKQVVHKDHKGELKIF